MLTETIDDPILEMISAEDRLWNLAVEHEGSEDEEVYSTAARALFERIKSAEPTNLENAAALLEHTDGQVEEINDRVVAFLRRLAREQAVMAPLPAMLVAAA